MPAWGRDIRVWWRSDGTGVAVASKGGEDGATSHCVAMSARHRRNERDAQGLALECLYVDLELPTVRPVGVRHGHDRLLEARAKVWGNVDLDAKLLRQSGCLWIRARDQHAAVGEKRRFRVIHPSDGRVAEDRDTRADRLRRVVQQRGEVRIACKTKAGDTRMCAIYDHESAVWQGNEARHNTFRGLRTGLHQWMQLITWGINGRTIRSITHVGLAVSGCVLTQLSSATPKLEPPQTRIVIGSV